LLLACAALTQCQNEGEVPALPATQMAEPQVQVAIAVAHRAVQEDPDNAQAWGRLAMTLDVHEFVEPALEAYADAAARDPNDARWVYYPAVRLANTDPEAATSMFERTRVLRPDDAAVHVRLGRALEQLGRQEDAFKSFERAAQLDDQNVPALAGIGRSHLAAGRLAEARTALERALEIEPGSGVVLSVLAQVYEQQGESAQAASMSERAANAPQRGVMHDPLLAELEALGRSTPQVINRAAMYAEAGDVERAISALKDVIAANGTRSESHLALGQYQLQRMQFDAAAASFAEALRIDPKSIKARLGAADTLRFTRRFPEAVQAYRDILQIDYEVGEAYRGIGICLVQQNELAGATSQLRKALALLPEDRAVRSALARLEYLNRNDAAVVETLSPLVNAAAETTTPLDRLALDAMLFTGLARIRLGEQDEGLRLVQESLTHGQDRVLAARELSEMGRQELAIALLRDGLAQQRDNDTLVMALAFELAASPRDDIRNGDEALRLADEVIARGAGGLRALEIRAIALAELGRFAEAVSTMEQALLLARQGAPPMIVAQLESRLAMFQRNERFRYDVQPAHTVAP